MKQKHVFPCMLVLFLLCLLFTGCHGSRGLEPFILPSAFDTSRDYEITFWAKNDTNKAQTRIYEKAIADFEVLYPNIKINLRLYTDYSRIYNDVITNIATQTTPNICITYPDHIATYLTGINTVVPLHAVMTDQTYGLGGTAIAFDAPKKDEIIDAFLEECAFDGDTYALPFMRSTEACYINQTYVEKLGYSVPDVLTWDFIWEVSEAAMAQNPDGTYLVNGQNVLIPFIYKSTDNMMISALRQKGAGYSNADGDVAIFNDTTRALLYTIAEHAKTGAFSTFKISSYPANFLNAGQCIFAIDSTAGATWMGSDAPLSDISEDQFVQFETAVRPIPQYDTEHPQMISQGPSMCIFNKRDPQEVLASWLFMQYLLTNDVQIAYAQTEGYVPVTKKAQESTEYQEYLSRRGEDHDLHYSIKIDAAQLLLHHLDHTFVTPVYNGSASLRTAAGQMIENVTKSVRRKETVDDAYINRLYADMNALYRLDQHDTAVAEKASLGPLPTASIVFLCVLCCIWVLLLGNVILQKVKFFQKNRKNT